MLVTAYRLAGRRFHEAPHVPTGAAPKWRRGGAPGGAAPYVTGGCASPAAGPVTGLTAGARAGLPMKVCQRVSRKHPVGPRKPLAPPGAPSPPFRGTENRERAYPAPENSKEYGPAERWLFNPLPLAGRG